MAKRKTEAAHEVNGHHKKRAIEDDGMQKHFRSGLFDPGTVDNFIVTYAASAPYKHAVVSDLIDDALLRAVRGEIIENIHFTPKETDIYKIHQSGDLANLDGLPTAALERLPSLLKLRDALYCKEFRHWISTVSGAGPVSGKKTDMAVNVYVPGCHLLCHDDVIGSRRISYILYLTSPDSPWKPEWGGALRLYPVQENVGEDGKSYKIPQAEWNKVIPPAWNQLSFFAVQPGESFHDVEEVYAKAFGESDDDGGRVRMAISGWFHIPQEGEEGFEPGLAESLAEKSSLQQLQGKADRLDTPGTQWDGSSAIDMSGFKKNEEVESLSEQDLEFLLQYMTANYLTPDTVEELQELFEEESTLQLSNFLSKKFSEELRLWLVSHPEGPRAGMLLSRPPYKHRFLYATPKTDFVDHAPEENPYGRILNDFLPSLAYRKWLSLATGLTLRRSAILARQFRRGLDYQLAQNYDGEDPQLEYTLNITPTGGWGADQDGEDVQENGQSEGNTSGKSRKATESSEKATEEDNVGGYELYMAGDLEDDDCASCRSDQNMTTTSKSNSYPHSHTGAGDRRSSKKAQKADPAVYRSAVEDEDDGILFSNPASWNTMSIVLRDRGTLKFIKYVSKSALGDRFDFTGTVECAFDEEGEEDEIGTLFFSRLGSRSPTVVSRRAKYLQAMARCFCDAGLHGYVELDIYLRLPIARDAQRNLIHEHDGALVYAGKIVINAYVDITADKHDTLDEIVERRSVLNCSLAQRKLRI
nr:prolyl 3,4-dihydroxylase ofd1 [Quercus suber]